MFQYSNNGQGGPTGRGGYHQAANHYGQQAAHQQQYGQHQYGQQGYQGGFQHGGSPGRGGAHHANSYPPAKRQKGNPVITRFAPPPGYQPPPAGQPWQTNQFQGYQQAQQQHAPNFQRPSGPPNFQSGWQPQPSQQYGPGPVYQSPQGYTGPPQNYPHPQGAQSYPNPGYQQDHQQQHRGHGSGSYPPNQAPHAQPGYPQQQPYWQGPQHQPHAYSGPNMQQSPPGRGSMTRSSRSSIGSGQNMSATSYTGNHEQSYAINVEVDLDDTPREPDPNDPLNMRALEWGFEPEGAIWPKANEPVDNKLSLGLIPWHPGNEIFRALSHSFAKAEELAKAAPPARIGLGDSVSQYFTRRNHENAYDDIRSIRHWARIKQDPVFFEFPPATEYELVDIASAKAKCDRPAVQEEVMEGVEEDGEIEGDDDDNASEPMQGSDDMNQPEPYREASPEPGDPNNSAGHRPGEKKYYRVDQTQEDILASLGVEGIAKPVFPTPGPAYGAPSGQQPPSPRSLTPQRSASFGANAANAAVNTPDPPQPQHQQHEHVTHDRQPPDAHADPERAQTSENRSVPTPHVHRAVQPHVPPPPPEPPIEPAHQTDTYNPWDPDQGMPYPRRSSPARSDKSNHTHVGSDFDQDATAGATANGREHTPETRMDVDDSKLHVSRRESSGRKRSFDNYNQDSGDENAKRRQSDDGGKGRRVSKSKAHVDHAYGRRW